MQIRFYNILQSDFLHGSFSVFLDLFIMFSQGKLNIYANPTFWICMGIQM